MSQTYLMRYPLIHGQGSLGTQENNDMVASMRYTEAKPSKYTDLMMNDFKKGVVPLKETYNGEFMEPVVLPGLFPNALCNGRQAIGISMAHNSLPNNLSEVCDAIVAYIKKGSLTVDELMEYIPGPDFPLPNTVINKNDIRAAFATGHSTNSLKVRGEYIIKNDKIIFTSIPYRTYRNKIKEQIEKNIEVFEELISDFSDESNLGENKLIFTIKKGVNNEDVLNKLFKLTDLQTTLSYNMNYIINGTPKLCSMMDLIQVYIEHQTKVLIIATEYDKEKAERRKHILEGLLLIISNIDKAINIIRSSTNSEEAKNKLVTEFNIDEVQAKAVLDMKLAKLTKLDKDGLIKELEEKKLIIAECDKIINDSSYRNNKLIDKVTLLKEKYGDKRRTKLLNLEIPKEEEKESIPPEDVVVIISQSENIKRIPKTAFKVQKRNGKGIKNENEAVLSCISTNTIDNLLLFTSKGKMYKLLVNNIPEGKGKGTNINTLITAIESNEKVIAVTSLQQEVKDKYVIFFTKKGFVKKTLLEEYTKVRRGTGIASINLKENDSLASVSFVTDNEEIIIVTKNGMCLKFNSDEIDPTGRVTIGTRSIKLDENDEVLIGLVIKNQIEHLAIFLENGYGRKIPLKEVILQSKGMKGIILNKDKIAGVCLINDNDNILLIGQQNSICIKSTDIPLLKRASVGNLMIKEGRITSIVKL